LDDGIAIDRHGDRATEGRVREPRVLVGVDVRLSEALARSRLADLVEVEPEEVGVERRPEIVEREVLLLLPIRVALVILGTYVVEAVQLARLELQGRGVLI